jgi:hypothetical protein
MNQIVTRLRAMLIHAPLGFTVTADGAYPVAMPARGDRPKHRWTAALPPGSATSVESHRDEADPVTPIDPPPAETTLWRWQDVEGLDKPLAYSR